MDHGRHTSTLRLRHARPADLNDVADLWSDRGPVPSARGFPGALLGFHGGRTATVWRLATHRDHVQDGPADRCSGPRAAPRRAADGEQRPA